MLLISVTNYIYLKGMYRCIMDVFKQQTYLYMYEVNQSKIPYNLW
jgi:hypothetical protein